MLKRLICGVYKNLKKSKNKIKSKIPKKNLDFFHIKISYFQAMIDNHKKMIADTIRE